MKTLKLSLIAAFIQIFGEQAVLAQAADEVDMEQQLIQAVNRNNKAKILGYIKQDPSLLFSLVEDDAFVDNPDKIIHIFTVMKKAGVNLNYKDDGEIILDVVVDTLIGNIFVMPLIEGLIGSFAHLFTGDQDQDDQLKILESDDQLVVKIKNTQKLVKALLKLGVKKEHVRTRDGYQTAADVVKECMDEFSPQEAQEYPKTMHELQVLYKILK